MSQKLFQYVAKGNYTAFKKFVSEQKNHEEVDENVVVYIYTTYQGKWVTTLLSHLKPSSEKVVHAILSYQPQSVVEQWKKKWGISEDDAVAVMRDGTRLEAQKLIKALSSKISVKAEIEMLKRDDLDLLQAWILKFGNLEGDSEALLNDDPKLSTLLNYYMPM